MPNIHPTRSYRCHTRQPNTPPATDPSLESFIQLKAPNAVKAMELAHLVTGLPIIDAERQDAVIDFSGEYMLDIQRDGGAV